MEDWQEWDYLENEILARKRGRFVLLAITSGTARQVLVSPSLPVHFIKSLFLKEIISLKDVDIGGKTAGYLLQKQLDKNIYSDLINIQL